MGDGKTLSIAFESPVKGGVKVIKTYTFTRGSYVINVDTKVQNVGTAPVTPRLYMELVRDNTPVETPRFSHTFIGPAVYTDQHHFQKIDFSDIDKDKATFTPSADNGWIAMVQHYFASAWIPQQGVKRDIYVQKIDPSLYRVGVQQPLQTIAPGQTVAGVQAKLQQLGYYTYAIDGTMGPLTKAAIGRYQSDQRLPVSYGIDPATLGSLGIVH